MWIKELLADYLATTSIFEMAFHRQIAKNKVTDLSPQIFKHLLKIWVLEYPNDSNHWRKEINTWFYYINDIRLKPNNKKPSKQELYHWLIFDSAPHYSIEYINEVIETWDGGEYETIRIRDFDPAIVLEQILQVINQVCADISVGKFKNINNYL